MATTMAAVTRVGQEEAHGVAGRWQDRFLVDGTRTQGRVAVVEHTLAARVLAAPVHLHTREDEHSVVVEGRLGVLLGDEEVYAEPGDVVAKPRGQWHTFWNAGDSTLRILEIITPGGVEELLKELGRAGGEYDPAGLPAAAGRYGCSVDFEATAVLAERLGLLF